MANKITYVAGTSAVGATASRFTADTSGGNVTLILPSISEQQRFQEFGSGLNVSGTFNFAFEKTGNASLIFKTSIAEDTINGISELVVNEIGSGIIFISSDNSWGIVNFSSSNNSIMTSKVDVSIVSFDSSSIDSPILVVPAIANNINISTHIILTITTGNGSGGSVSLGYGYVGNKTLIAEVDLTTSKAGDRIIVPLITPKQFDSATDPIGLGFGVFKVSGGGVSFIAQIVSFEIAGN